jgi:predicted transcriptional regulator
MHKVFITISQNAIYYHCANFFHQRNEFWKKLRDRISIICQILEVAKRGGATKTRIMYKANLSHDQMKEYLTILTENYFIYYNLHSHTFKITEKGLRVLEAYNGIEDMMKAPLQPSLQPPVPLQLQV